MCKRLQGFCLLTGHVRTVTIYALVNVYTVTNLSRKEKDPPMFLQKSRNLFLLTLILCLLMSALCAFAEEAGLPESPVIRTAENAEIDTDCSELSSCSVTFRNTRAYTPEDFNTAKVVEKRYEPWGDGAGQDVYEYRYADDALLSVTSDTSLCYGNRDADRYSQLLTYLDNADIEPDAI